MPAHIGHREKWLLALDALEDLITWGIPPRVVLADAVYGVDAAFRGALSGRALDRVLSVGSGATTHPFDAVPEAPARKGANRCRPQPRYRWTPLAVAAHAVGLGCCGFSAVTWRQGSRGPRRSHFAALRVHPACNSVIRPLRARAAAEQGWWDGVLPGLWLLAEWLTAAEAPTEYWFSNLPADTGLGLDHFEGRSWPGRRHYVALATAAHAFLTEQRLSPNNDRHTGVRFWSVNRTLSARGGQLRDRGGHAHLHVMSMPLRSTGLMTPGVGNPKPARAGEHLAGAVREARGGSGREGPRPGTGAPGRGGSGWGRNRLREPRPGTGEHLAGAVRGPGRWGPGGAGRAAREGAGVGSGAGGYRSFRFTAEARAA
ncbi:hypothetical protein OEIGOIKO_01977 [Streptomyces chrestomyceticus JCM 4735]|uniref:Transposase IS701-like DDE domain-containing protein n=1 Tax=Streptomyces chrestomyceticus JCM 4735 TaxID=1306181 RepID=A0A7U9KRY6_9ACTN|nr:hypothetical protein OEIGOIKO_01977 [Streptomyces chrestomyceticus JCM 4735]